MGTKLYVGNLSYSTGTEALRAVFERDGWNVTSVSIVTDRETGRSRGFGFVQMESPEQAREAISALDGFELDGRNLRVTEARESNSSRRGSGPRGNAEAREPHNRRGAGRRGNAEAREPHGNRRGPGPVGNGGPGRSNAPRQDGAGSGPQGVPRSAFGDRSGPADRGAIGWDESGERGRAARGRNRRGVRDRRDNDLEQDLERDFQRKGSRRRDRGRDWRRDWDV